eukprot:3344772-Amphidinium_carterae.1
MVADVRATCPSGVWLSAYASEELPLADQEVLNDELARTGCKDQIFRSELVDRQHLHHTRVTPPHFGLLLQSCTRQMPHWT